MLEFTVGWVDFVLLLEFCEMWPASLKLKGYSTCCITYIPNMSKGFTINELNFKNGVQLPYEATTYIKQH